MSILQKIFSDHFHKLSNSGIKIRDTVIENIDKMIRYYGIYAKHHRHEGNLKLFISKEKKTFPHPSKCLENVYFLVISFRPTLVQVWA